ncbi:cytochrome P450 [Trametes punicea]|nr:cytochrome P450 [Trametes punicea]
MASHWITPSDVLVVALACVLFAAVHTSRNTRKAPLPPGPRGLPLVGNAFDIPMEQSWIAYRDMSNTYGDVVALHAVGQTLVVLSSVAAAVDLLEKRSAIYSDRQASVLAEMIGWTWNLAFKRYGDDWRRVRRLFWHHFQPNVVQQYQAVQQRDARELLRLLLEDQTDLDGQTKLSLTKTILSAVHGIPVKDVTSHYVDILTASEAGVAEAFTPGAFLVEFLPWLRHVPEWVPGTGWKARVREWQGQSAAICEEPFKAAKNALKRGDAQPSMLTDLLESSAGGDVEERAIKETTAVAFGAGTDTTAATLLAFFCAMVLHPAVQKRAQAELDAVVGPDRLPEHADRPSLPYLDAMVKEILRWHNVAPLGVAHRCMQEDEYRGWRIPEGAIVMVNAWAILHDPEVFPEPEVFRPERFLKGGKSNPDILDPASVAFGFGRRVCPGRHFADDALFIYIATLLHALDIGPAFDRDGKPIPVEAKMTSGFLSYVAFTPPVKLAIHGG